MKFDDPAVQRLLTQSEALSTALAYVERGTGREGVLRLVKLALDGGVFLTVEELTTQSAMYRILGQEGPINHRFDPAVRPYERKLFETIAQAWMIWAAEEPPGEALEALHQLQEDTPPKKGALHLMALQPWKLAVEALLEEDLAEAKRRFLRSAELGGQFGTETNPVIQWTFVATLFPFTR